MHLPALSRATRAPLAGFATLSVALLTLACGGNGPTAPTYDGPESGVFSDSATRSAPARVQFTAGRTGPTTVAICGREGSNLDLVAGGVSSATDSNCESVTFQAVAGRSYTVTVVNVAGAGRFNGCFAPGTTACEVAPPTVDGGPASPSCTRRPFSAADTSVPAGYYASAEGKTGTALISALYAITCTNRNLTYTPARDSMYANIDDPDNDDIIYDIYVGRSATINSRATAAAADINTEHTWPQSRGANEEPAQSDLHILFSADETANSVRSNNPFGRITGTVTWTSPAVAGQTERSRLGQGASGTVFEPRDSKKGDVARAILYFYVRYRAAPTASFSLANFNVEESTLIQWSQQDPPDAFERARNNLIFRAQGNRNPFIDHPEYVTAIGDFPNN